MTASSGQKKSILCPKTFAWARLNFELQSFFCRPELMISAEIKDKLCEIGYPNETLSGLCPQEVQKLFKEGDFFSCIKTGNRIVAFALQENGLSKEGFKEMEETITSAYLQIKRLDTENSLLEQSYTYTLEALAVFRP